MKRRRTRPKQVIIKIDFAQLSTDVARLDNCIRICFEQDRSIARILREVCRQLGIKDEDIGLQLDEIETPF